jgi:hypothetical protein
MGGILQTDRLEGFLANFDHFYEVADREAEIWRNLVAL